MIQDDQLQALLTLAREKRSEFGVTSSNLNVRLMQRIFRDLEVQVDTWKVRSSKIRAAYFSDLIGSSVLVKKDLPREPKIFAMAHELKHHFFDQEELRSGKLVCDYGKTKGPVEVGANAFAAEFVYPASEMRLLIQLMSLEPGKLRAEDIVHFKKRCPAPISYQFIVRRFHDLEYCDKADFKSVKFTILEEQIFGKPIYKQEWFQEQRKQKAARKSGA